MEGPSVPGGREFQLKKQLQHLLEVRSLTAAELARRSGVPKQVLSLWLAGVEPRKLSHLKRVAEVLGLTVDELCFGPLARGQPVVQVQIQDSWFEGVFEGRIRRVRKGEQE